jgi:signal transduction histidine kinase/DNA-binding response OmpR family regulator
VFGINKKSSIGENCYKVFRGADQPCPNCLVFKLISKTKHEIGQDRTYEQARFYDEKLGKWFSGRAAAIRWVDGSFVLLYYLTDETVKQKYETELENVAQSAKLASMAKSAFLANMSHEIRTPMNVVLSLTEILLEKNSLPKDALESLEKIYSSGDILMSIINDILDLSKIEAGKLELIPIKYETASLINDTVQLNIMRFESKPVEFKLQVDENVPSTLFGDELRIKQILNNLLSNAAKYTKKGKVTFSVGAESDDEHITLVIKVHDTGQGMTEEQVSQLFDNYARFNAEDNRAIEGTGLGMSITWNLIKIMNGTISVESTPGKGTEFTVCLPQGNTGSGALGKEMVKNLRQFRLNVKSRLKKSQVIREPMPYGSVLVVDDVEANLYVATGLLTPYGIGIETAASGFEAIELIRSRKEYDIVFMDHMMPKMDGVEAVKIIRGIGYTRPIVALTANAVVGQSDFFLANGFDAFISKPIDTRQLNDLLNKLIRDKYKAISAQDYDDQNKDTISAETSDISNDSGDAHLLENLSRIEGLDVELGLSYVDQDHDIYFKVLCSFIGNCDSYIEELDKAMKDKAWQDYNIEAHALKGVLANLGAEKLSQRAAILEKVSKSGEGFSPEICREETLPFITDLSLLVNNIRLSLTQSPSGIKKVEKPLGDLQFLREQIGLLKEAYLDYSFGDTKKILSALEVYEWNAETEKELKNIHQFTASFDYDKAREVVERMDLFGNSVSSLTSPAFFKLKL